MPPRPARALERAGGLPGQRQSASKFERPGCRHHRPAAFDGDARAEGRGAGPLGALLGTFLAQSPRGRQTPPRGPPEVQQGHAPAAGPSGDKRCRHAGPASVGRKSPTRDFIIQSGRII